MAFCIYCGRKLEEGEICNCQDAQAGQELQNGQSVPVDQGTQIGQDVPEGQHVQAAQVASGGEQMHGQEQGGFQQGAQINMQQYQENFNQAKEISGIYLKKLLSAFLGVLKKPAEFGKEFVTSGEMKLGIGFFAVQAILSSIFALIICNKINNLGRQATSIVGDDKIPNILSYPKAFLLTIIGSLLLSFAVAGLLYLGVKLFKGETTFGHMVCVAAVRSVGVSVFLALSIVIVYLNVVWGFAFFILSWLVGLIYMIPMIQHGAEVDANRVTYIIIFVAILSMVAFYFWAKFSLPMYASGEMKQQFEEMIDEFNKLKTLGSYF